MAGPLRIKPGLEIPLEEIELRTSRSSGPGGQHANVTESRVQAVFRPAESSSLTDAQRRRLADRFGEVVAATAQDERSQLRNREIALARLGEKIFEALKPRKRRRPTRPGRAAKERRLAAKRIRSQRKRDRRRPGLD